MVEKSVECSMIIQSNLVQWGFIFYFTGFSLTRLSELGRQVDGTWQILTLIKFSHLPSASLLRIDCTYTYLGSPQRAVVSSNRTRFKKCFENDISVRQIDHMTYVLLFFSGRSQICYNGDFVWICCSIETKARQSYLFLVGLT